MENHYKFHIKNIATRILIWEIFFWSLFASLLVVFDYFSTSNTTNHLAFRNPEKITFMYFFLPIFIALNLGYLFWKNKKITALGNTNVLKTLFKPIRPNRFFISYFLIRNALVFTLIAMAQPVFGNKKTKGTLETMELVLAIDVSNSMNTRDIDPENSRLEIVKRAMSQLINNLHGEKIGICVFAGGAYIQLPITSDYEAAKMYVNEIETNMISNQGTNIAAAMEISLQMFSKEKTSKAILIVSDGENHEGNIQEVTQKIKENNILLAILGIGTKGGGNIPNDPYKPEMGYKVDAKGARIISKMNENLMQQIAQQAGGFSMLSSSPFPDLSQILTQFSQLKRTKVEGIELNIKENWYQIPLFLALLFFVMYAFVKQGFLLKNEN